MSELENVLCDRHQSANLILFFMTRVAFSWVTAAGEVMFKLLWRQFICAFPMLWKVHRECCDSRNCNLGWVDDCVPEITKRLTDSSNSRYCVRHYGDWCSKRGRVYGSGIIVTIRQYDYVSIIFRARVNSVIAKRRLTFSRSGDLVDIVRFWICRALCTRILKWIILRHPRRK